MPPPQKKKEGEKKEKTIKVKAGKDGKLVYCVAFESDT